MQTAELHFTVFIHFLNSGHERHANAVTELDAIEAKIDNFAQHFGAVGVPA